MTPQLPLGAYSLVTFSLLTFSLVSLWSLTGLESRRIFVPRTWNILLAASLCTALAGGMIDALSLVPLVLLAVAVDIAEQEHANPWHRTAAVIVAVLVSLALFAHWLPGFRDVVLIAEVVLSKGALTYSKNVDLGKAMVALLMIAAYPALLNSRARWRIAMAVALPRAAGVVVVTLGLGWAVGVAGWDIKFPWILPQWVWANLFVTCAAEEALFRGFMQRNLAVALDRLRIGNWVALLLVAMAFGAIHYHGGAAYMGLATVAGLGYGWVFMRTRSIEAAILSHFLLDLTHILLFTYPMLAHT